MGLERVAAVMQGVHSNYDIDLFRPDRAPRPMATHDEGRSRVPSLRVIADHIRACSFLIVDGVIPGNDGRGYVLRRIMRRAIRHGYQLGQRPSRSSTQLVPALAAEMGAAYPGAAERRRRTSCAVLKQEEERFAETLENGMELLEEAIGKLKGKTIAGDTVFKLYDTYGFPVDLTADIARERGLAIDQAGFEQAMEAQRERARAASKFGVDLRGAGSVDAESKFTGYEQLRDEGRVEAILTGRCGGRVRRMPATRCRSSSTGRRSTRSRAGRSATSARSRTARPGFRVTDTRKLGDAHLHIGKVEAGSFHKGDMVTAQVDAATRQATVLNHTATHLLHAALRKVLGPHVIQKGSLVAPDRLRFDFSHTQPVTAEELEAIERLVNAEIRRNAAGHIRHMSLTTPSRPARWRCSARSTATRCGCCPSASSRPSSAAARTCSAPATSACSGSPARAASPRASAASRR